MNFGIAICKFQMLFRQFRAQIPIKQMKKIKVAWSDARLTGVGWLILDQDSLAVLDMLLSNLQIQEKALYQLFQVFIVHT